MSHNSQQLDQEQASLNHQVANQNAFQAKLVISNNYRVAKKTHRIPVYFIDPGFDVNTGKVTIGVKWKKCSYEHSVFLNDLIVLKEKYLYELIPWIVNQLSNKNDETSKRIVDYINTVYKSVKSVEFSVSLGFM